MDALLAVNFAAWGLAQWAIAIVVTIGVVAIVVGFVRWAEIKVPAIIVNILWVLLVVIVAVAAIRFLVSLM